MRYPKWVGKGLLSVAAWFITVLLGPWPWFFDIVGDASPFGGNPSGYIQRLTPLAGSRYPEKENGLETTSSSESNAIGDVKGSLHREP